MKKVNIKKVLAVVLSVLTVLGIATGCGQKFDKSNDVTVITREEGSGTRGAFTELFKIENIFASAIVNDKTGIVLTTVGDDVNAIGYISLGSMKNSVKALEIDGAAATVENIKNGKYKIYRPFNIATKGDLSDAARDFVNFILSDDGQKVIEDKGYIKTESTGAYESTRVSGKVVIMGSSSVTPVMEKLKEAYAEINPNVSIEINMSDSSNGVKSVISGTCDIGMASRELKPSEIESGVQGTVIANDGIAIIVNNNNPLKGLSSEDVKNLYTGVAKKWEDLSGAVWAE